MKHLKEIAIVSIDVYETGNFEWWGVYKVENEKTAKKDIIKKFKKEYKEYNDEDFLRNDLINVDFVNIEDIK